MSDSPHGTLFVIVAPAGAGKTSVVRALVSLLPENPDFEPIEVDLRHQELVIEGLGVGVIRPHLDN